jgi:hypothetical protein
MAQATAACRGGGRGGGEGFIDTKEQKIYFDALGQDTTQGKFRVASIMFCMLD